MAVAQLTDRLPASDTRSQWFESSHRQKIKLNICSLHKCTEKTKKETGMTAQKTMPLANQLFPC